MSSDDQTAGRPLALPLPASGSSDVPTFPLPQGQEVGRRSGCESSLFAGPASPGIVPNCHLRHGQQLYEYKGERVLYSLRAERIFGQLTPPRKLSTGVKLNRLYWQRV